MKSIFNYLLLIATFFIPYFSIGQEQIPINEFAYWAVDSLVEEEVPHSISVFWKEAHQDLSVPVYLWEAWWLPSGKLNLINKGNIEVHHITLTGKKIEKYYHTHQKFPQDKGVKPEEWLGSFAYDRTNDRIFFSAYDKKKKFSRIYMINHASQKPKITPFPHLSDKAETHSPAISPDGKILAFVARLPEGTGGTDIYLSKWNGDSWSTPENAGQQVNTTKNEAFPQWGNTGKLYFSSNGKHKKRKDYELYCWDSKNGSSTILSYPYNSPYDDLAFTPDIQKAGGEGFLLSNRPFVEHNSANACFTLFEIKTKQKKYIQVTGNNKKPLSNISIQVSADSGFVFDLQTDSNGKACFYPQLNKIYKVYIQADEYNSLRKEVLFSKDSLWATTLRKTHYANLSVSVKDRKTYKKVENVKVLVIENEKDTAIYFTDASGAVTASLEPGGAYKIKISKPGYETATRTVSTRKTDQRTYSQNVRLTPITGHQIQGLLTAENPAYLNRATIHILNKQNTVLKLESDSAGRFSGLLNENGDFTIIATSKDQSLIAFQKLQLEELEYNAKYDTIYPGLTLSEPNSSKPILSFWYEDDPILIQAGSYEAQEIMLVLLQKFPELKLKAEIHTYNLKTDVEPAERCRETGEFLADFLRLNNIDETRVNITLKAASEPLQPCPIPSECTEVQHRQNQRIEIYYLSGSWQQ